MKVIVTHTDLQHDGSGWCENGSYVVRKHITLPDNVSDVGAARRILASVGAVGYRRDDWCVSDFGPWRSGTMGVYADIRVFSHKEDEHVESVC